MEIKIDKDIPLPPRGRPGVTATLRRMQVGESIFLPIQSIAQLGGTVQHAKPARFSSRTVVENEARGVRIWRIA